MLHDDTYVVLVVGSIIISWSISVGNVWRELRITNNGQSIYTTIARVSTRGWVV